MQLLLYSYTLVFIFSDDDVNSLKNLHSSILLRRKQRIEFTFIVIIDKTLNF